MVAQAAYPVGQGLVMGSDCARIAKGAQILARVEAETRDLPKASNPTIMIAGALCLRCILNQQDVLSSADLRNCIHIYRRSVKMHRNDRAGAWGDPFLKIIGIEQPGGRRRICRYHARTGHRYSRRSRNEGIGWDNDLIPGSDVQCA